MRRRILPASLCAALLWTAPAIAQEREYRTTFVHLAQGVPGVLYEPVSSGPKASIAVFSMHSGADYLNHSSCSELSKRGYRVLCANNSSSKSGGADEGNLDRTLSEMRVAIAWLRKVPGVRKVVLFGHSGGATIQTAYQMIAEGGVASCRRAELIYKCSEDLANLPAADGVILADANWGISTMALFSIDPAITDEQTGKRRNARLDLHNPANGFVPSHARYSDAFISRFLTAAGRRNEQVLANALARQKKIVAGRGRFSDDEPFVVPGAVLYGFNNKLFAQDVRLFSRSLKPWPLVHADGSVTVQMIRSVRVPTNNSNLSDQLRAAVKSTVKGYLNSFAIRTTPEFSYGETSQIRGVDWRSNYSNPPGNVQGISVPLLTLGMTGGWEGLAAETIHELAASTDKELAFIEGATHVYTPCKPCERTPGEFGDTVKTTYDYIDGWLGRRGRFD